MSSIKDKAEQKYRKEVTGFRESLVTILDGVESFYNLVRKLSMGIMLVVLALVSPYVLILLVPVLALGFWWSLHKENNNEGKYKP